MQVPPAAHQARVASKRSKVATCAAITRLAATSGLERVLTTHAQNMRSGMRSGEGKASLQRWAVEAADAAELHEYLLSLAGHYPVFDSSSDNDTA